MVPLFLIHRSTFGMAVNSQSLDKKLMVFVWQIHRILISHIDKTNILERALCGQIFVFSLFWVGAVRHACLSHPVYTYFLRRRRTSASSVRWFSTTSGTSRFMWQITWLVSDSLPLITDLFFWYACTSISAYVIKSVKDELIVLPSMAYLGMIDFFLFLLLDLVRH